MALDYIKIDFSWTEVTQTLTDAERGRLVDDLVRYARDGVEPEDFRGNERYVFPLLKVKIDEEKRSQERRASSSRKNGCKGGRPKKTAAPETQENPDNPAGFLGFQNNPENLSGFLGSEEKPQNAEITQFSAKSSGNPENPAGFLGFEDGPISSSGSGNSFDSDNPFGYERREDASLSTEPTEEPIPSTTKLPLQEYVKQNLYHLSPGNWEALRELMADGITDELVRKAIDIATASRARTWAFVQSILNRWLCEGILTLDAVKADETKRKARAKGGGWKAGARKPGTPPELTDGVNPFAEVSS